MDIVSTEEIDRDKGIVTVTRNKVIKTKSQKNHWEKGYRKKAKGLVMEVTGTIKFTFVMHSIHLTNAHMYHT